MALPIAQISNEYTGHNSKVLASKYGVSADTLRGMVWRFRRKQQQQITEPVPISVVTLEPRPGWLSITDKAQWEQERDAILNSSRFVRVMHLCDLHFPFHEPLALSLAYKLVELIKPDIVVRGSDEDDNPTISRYIEDGSTEPDIGDFLDVMQMHRLDHSLKLKAITGAIQVNIEGNHGWRRFERWVNKNGYAAADVLKRHYIDNVRSGGLVRWIGAKQSVVIGSLVVEHGKSHAVHAAKKNLENRSFQYSIMSGHTHRPQMFTVNAGNKSKTATVSGCLCILPEPYANDEEDAFSIHQHGTAYATLDTRTGETDITEVRFHKSDGGMWFELGGKIYEVTR